MTAAAAPAAHAGRSRSPGTIHNIGRGDLAVVAFCALGAGNLWARWGTGNPEVAPSAVSFVLGFALLVMAALTCYIAVGRRASIPGAAVCAAAIAAQALLAPPYLLPIPQVFVAGVLFAVVPMVRSRALSWALVAGGAVIIGIGVAGAWNWGSSDFDVFTEVQGSTAALLRGQNPYSPVYSVLIGWHGKVPVYGSASFCYGPMVVLLSIPARVVGDVRLTVLLLNASVLGALLVWARRALGDNRLGPTIAALLCASPFLPFMVLTEWTDSFGVAGMAWWLVLRDRHRVPATLALTLGITSKPSMLLLLLPLMAWRGGPRRELLWASAASLVVVAPFALWTGVPQFVYDTVGVFGDLPARPDGITLDGLATVLGHAFVPGGILSLGVAGAVLLFLRRRPLDYGSALAAGAGMLTVVCLFGKQAFLNYYYIAAIGLLFTVGGGTLAAAEAPWSPGLTWARGARRRVGLGRQEAVVQSDVLTESGLDARPSTR